MSREFTVAGGSFVRLDDAPEHPPEFEIRTNPGVKQVRMDVASFASAIAAMTPQGDTAETFAAAERFLKTGSFVADMRH